MEVSLKSLIFNERKLSYEVKDEKMCIFRDEKALTEAKASAEAENRVFMDCECCGPTKMLQDAKIALEEKQRILLNIRQRIEDERKKNHLKRFFLLSIPEDRRQVVINYLGMEEFGSTNSLMRLLNPLTENEEAFISLLSDEAKSLLIDFFGIEVEAVISVDSLK